MDEAMKRAKEIVDQMTVEEQAGLLKYDSAAVKRLGIPAYNWWNEALHGVARAGAATVFPQAIGLAATFDAELVGQIGEVIATEARAKYNGATAEGDRDIYKGLTLWSPNINIFRDPRWGRGHETYGEDPYLTGRMGVAFVKGLQGEGKYLKSAACAKHYAVHSGPEAIRHEFDVQVSEKDLWETYLPAFEDLVTEARVEGVMGAYNRVNGEPCCGSRRLLGEILRGKWGFEGYVTSDCWAIRDFHTHHMVTSTAPESAALALKNGCDVNCGNTYLIILQALQEGLVTREDIALAATRLMATRIRLGLMDEDCPYNRISPLENDTDEHAALALKAARKSMTMLKNDGILPLNPNEVKTVAVIGPNADSIEVLNGNYNGTSSRYVTFLEGIRRACEGGPRVLYSQGSHLCKDRVESLAYPDDRIAEAVYTAKLADVTILCLGLDATLEGEEDDLGNSGFIGDKANLELPECQKRLLNAVIATGAKVITVLSCGSAMNVREGNAVIWTGYPGQAGGTALADMLFGRVSPSGKLPVTFYHSCDELPPFVDYAMSGRTYRYFAGEALYPFGFGLSYSKFEYSNTKVTPDAVYLDVANVGDFDADDVPQVYVKADSPYAPTNPRLCGFKRVSLASGERKTVRIPLDPRANTVVNEDGERVQCENLAFYVGSDSANLTRI